VKVLALGVLALVSSHSAFAIYHGPLLLRETYPGHVAPGFRLTTQCQVWADKVVRTVVSEGVSVSQSTAAMVSTPTLLKVIDAAKAGQLKRESAPVDGPGVVDVAIRILPNDGIEKIILLKANGGDGEVVTNLAAEAKGLRLLLDRLCK